MAKHRYYYYDSESCTFVELRSRRRRVQAQVAGVVLASLALALVLTWGMDHVVETPQELALRAENQALQTELQAFSSRIASVTSELDELSETDQNLYRSLLQADPISPDVRQVGVGGTDAYAGFARFSPRAADLLRTTAQDLDRLEMQLGLQRDSYDELARLAGEHATHLEEIPAIIPTEGRVTSGFGLRYHPILKVRRMHYGVDILVPRGTPVVTAGDGVIKETGRSASFGNYIKVEHPTAGYVTLYAHLNRFEAGLREGLSVKRGQTIGYSGNTGLSKAPHLHYEIHDLDGRAVNPILFLAPSMTPAAYRELVAEAEASTASFD